MVFTEVGTSVEGKKIAFQCRKFYVQRPYKEERLKYKTVYPVKLSIFGIATIETELNPKKHIISKSSHLNKGDEIRGEAIKLFSIKPIPDKSVKHGTGKHKANFSYSKDDTYRTAYQQCACNDSDGRETVSCRTG